MRKNERKINIITRTSNRPNYFKKNYESIKKQKYSNYTHWVISDDPKNNEYLEKYTDIEVFNIDKNSHEKMVSLDIANPNRFMKAPYNLYFNQLFPNLHGWIIILDDDDTFAHNNVLHDINQQITSYSDMILFKMQYANGNILPNQYNLYKRPQLGAIGSCCVVIHSSIAQQIKWDGWKCADYRYILKAWTLSINKKWINKVFVKIGSNSGNLGQKNDISNITNNNNNNIITFSDNIAMLKNKLLSRSKYKINANFQQTPNKIENNALPSDDKLHINIVAVGWNCSKYISEFYNSFLMQKKGNYTYHLHVLNDGSNDDTYNKLLAIKSEFLTIYNNKNNQGAAFSRWRILNELHDSNSIIAIVDLDDCLESNALKIISDVYNENENIKMTLGSYKWNAGHNPENEVYSDNVINLKSYKTIDKFKAPPLRSFKSNLLVGFMDSNFKDNRSDKWLQYCTDVALILPILMKLTADEVFFIKEKIYIYRLRTDGTMQKFKGKKKEMFKYIKNRL
jgi:hypothetical protein